MVFAWLNCYANGMEFHSLVTVGEKCGTFGLGRYPPFPLMIHFSYVINKLLSAPLVMQPGKIISWRASARSDCLFNQAPSQKYAQCTQIKGMPSLQGPQNQGRSDATA